MSLHMFAEKPKGMTDAWFLWIAEMLVIYYLGENLSSAWADAEYIEKVLKMHNLNVDFIRWLLERMIEEERPAEIVVIEKYLAAAGALDEDSGSRFEL